MSIEEYRVKFNYYAVDLADENYRVLQEGDKTFETYVDAIEFSRLAANNRLDGVRVVGNPYIEPILNGDTYEV